MIMTEAQRDRLQAALETLHEHRAEIKGRIGERWELEEFDVQRRVYEPFTLAVAGLLNDADREISREN